MSPGDVDRVVKPRHYVSMAEEANDTELHGLDWDENRLELLIDWRRMYSAFLGEEGAYDEEFRDVVCFVSCGMMLGKMNFLPGPARFFLVE